MLNERMKVLSGQFEKVVKDYQKLLEERNKCLELLCVKFEGEDENKDENNEREEISLVEEIKKALENAMGLDEEDDGRRRGGKGRKGKRRKGQPR